MSRIRPAPDVMGARRHEHSSLNAVAMAVGLVSLSSAVMLIQLLYAYYAPLMLWVWMGAR